MQRTPHHSPCGCVVFPSGRSMVDFNQIYQVTILIRKEYKAPSLKYHYCKPPYLYCSATKQATQKDFIKITWLFKDMDEQEE